MQRQDDATLMAYVDGELDAAGVAGFERAMAADPALARQVRVLRDANTALRAAYNSALREPVPERLLAPLGAQPRGWRAGTVRRYSAMAAALALAVLGGMAIYANSNFELPYTIQATSQTNWLNSVANYHSVYVRAATRDERLLVDVNADDMAYLEEWFGRRLKRDVRLPKLDAQGFQLQGGRVVFVEGQPAAQFFYKEVAGDAVVSMTIAQTRRRDVNWTETHRGSLLITYWRRAGYAYVFAGNVERHVLDAVASSVTDDQERT